MDNIDLKYAELKGIKVVNTPLGPTQSVAELALGLTLSALREILQAHSDMKIELGLNVTEIYFLAKLYLHWTW